jgi:signal transduction histidine kinase
MPATSTAPGRTERQLHNLRFLEDLRATLAGCRDERAVYSSAVHRVSGHFGARSVQLAAYNAIGGQVERLAAAGASREWDREAAMRAVHEARTVSRPDVVTVPVLCSRGAESVWGVLSVALPDGHDHVTRSALRAAAATLTDEIERRRNASLESSLDGLLRKTKPIDVYTHALRDLRRFVPYDHSASIMTVQRGVARITVRAEKVVSTGGKRSSLHDSPRLGRAVRTTAKQARFLERLRQPLELVRDGDGLAVVADARPADAAGIWRFLSIGGSIEPEESILCVPLVFGGQMLGVLRLASRHASAFCSRAHYLSILERFARLLAVTLYRSELYQQSEHQLSAIKEMGRAITEPMSVTQVAEEALRIALRVLRAEVGVVGLLNEAGELELIAHQGSTLDVPPTLFPGDGIAGKTVLTGRPRAIPSVDADPDYVIFNTRVRSELVVPVAYHGEVLGFLDVESYEEGRFREEDEEVISFLEALANQAAIAFRTARLREQAMSRLGPTLDIDPAITSAGLQALLVEELRDKIEQLGAANEHLAAANQAKSDFLARMSHDLRGPLNVIVGLTNLLTDPDVAPTLTPEKQQESLNVIRSSGAVLARLIGDILDLSALEAGQVGLVIRPVDARAAFEYLRAAATRLADENGRMLEIGVSTDPTIAMISVDEEKFLRIMLNVIGNAVKFTPSGGRIGVEALIDDRDGAPVLHITVSDTGAGVPEEHREAIFEAFRRLGHEARGTGLGLAVVRQLVELHEGRVWVEPNPGGGSLFHMVLPHAFTVPAGAVLHEEVPLSGAAIARRSKGLVLVVEDTPAHMDMMRLAVTSRGYEMHGVETGEEALSWLQDHRPDAILLDMQLPGMDGFQVAARVKARIETHSIPLVAITADALPGSEGRARASGCDAYLTKPIDIGKLLQTLEGLLV